MTEVRVGDGRGATGAASVTYVVQVPPSVSRSRSKGQQARPTGESRAMNDRIQLAIHRVGLCSRTPCCAFCRIGVPRRRAT